MAERDRPSHPPDDEGGFLRRWSRRKAEARQAERQDVAHAEPQAEAGSEPARAAATEAIDPDTLPDVDSLTAASDFKPFMRPGVPQELRRRALRKLWRLDPKLANLDGLLEYGEDYSQVGHGVTAVRTAYQVGRGFLEKLDQIEEVTAEDARTAAARVEAEADAASGRPQAEASAREVDPPAADPTPEAGRQRRTHPERSGPRRRLPRRG